MKFSDPKAEPQKDCRNDHAVAVGQQDLEIRQRIDADDQKRDAGDVAEDLHIEVAYDAQRLDGRHA
jgi:hypothetical protein